LQHLLCRFLSCSRTETPQGSQLAFAPGDVPTRIRPAPGRRSLFPTPIPVPPSVDLTVSLPPLQEERSGLTTFHKVNKNGLGALSSPVALRVHDREEASPCARYSAFWPKPVSIFGLSVFHDVYRECTCVHHTIHPAPSPLDASRYAVPSRCGRQSEDCGFLIRGLLTARYLAAVPRRILLMEQQDWSIQIASQLTLRPRVASRLRSRDYSRPLASEPDVKVSLHPAQASQRPGEGPVSSHKTC